MDSLVLSCANSNTPLTPVNVYNIGKNKKNLTGKPPILGVIIISSLNIGKPFAFYTHIKLT